MLALVLAPHLAIAQSRGVGMNLVSAHVYRDARRAGASLQPSAWTELKSIHTLIRTWASVEMEHPSLDDVVLHTRTGAPVGSWGWLGGTIHWDWTSPGDSLESHSLEVGSVLTWFKPPYRPVLVMAYDVIARDGVLAIVSIPYTIRLAWLPPTTFIPEIGLRIRGSEPLAPEVDYISLSALVERRIGWLTIVPVTSIVPSGKGLSEWIFWVGVHLSAVR